MDITRRFWPYLDGVLSSCVHSQLRIAVDLHRRGPKQRLRLPHKASLSKDPPLGLEDRCSQRSSSQTQCILLSGERHHKAALWSVFSSYVPLQDTLETAQGFRRARGHVLNTYCQLTQILWLEPQLSHSWLCGLGQMLYQDNNNICFMILFQTLQGKMCINHCAWHVVSPELTAGVSQIISQ